ncbi:MAG: alpha/beta hydrolase [Steroidobacteraceae bacterium]|jgi:triacylglycerol lipase
MKLRARPRSAGPPPKIEARLRALGAVLDLRTSIELYSPLLACQPRAGVQITRDEVYGSDARHRLDVYAPAQIESARAVLLIFHGGGFIRGDKSERENAGLYFARAGFVTILPNYRLAPEGQWPSGAEDVMAALRWSTAHAARFGGDPAQIWLIGESAGAAHVATASLLRRFHPPEGLNVQGVVLISGVYNVQLERLARAQFGVPTPDPRNEPYFGSDSQRYPAMSVVELVDAPPLPLLITYAELDLLQMQVQAGELFARLVTRHGFTPQLAVIRGHNHLSQIISINTGDESLSAPILGFVRAR